MKSSLRVREVKPPDQGGIQLLAAVTVADVAVVDVSVIMQHKFQQSLFRNPWCLIQFINRVVVLQLLYRDRYAQRLLCRRRGDSTVAVLGPRCCARFVERQVWVQTVQKTVELPQVQCGRCCDHTAFVPAVQVVRFSRKSSSLDRVPDIPVMPLCSPGTRLLALCLRQLPMVQTVLGSCVKVVDILVSRSEVEVPQIQSSTEFNDNLEADLGAFLRILRHFSDSPDRG